MSRQFGTGKALEIVVFKGRHINIWETVIYKFFIMRLRIKSRGYASGAGKYENKLLASYLLNSVGIPTSNGKL